MRIRERRKEYLTAQALTYITAGLFLISYTNVVQAKEFIFLVGITLCALSFIYVFVVTVFPKYISKMELIDSYIKIPLLPITFIALFLNLTDTIDRGFFELRFLIFFFWGVIAVLSMGVSGFKIVSIHINIGNDVKGFFYKVFIFLGLMSSGMGLFFVVYGIYEPESTKLLISFNKWLYDPMLWFAIAILCVFPILILTPDDCDDNDKKQ